MHHWLCTRDFTIKSLLKQLPLCYSYVLLTAGLITIHMVKLRLTCSELMVSLPSVPNHVGSPTDFRLLLFPSISLFPSYFEASKNQCAIPVRAHESVEPSLCAVTYTGRARYARPIFIDAKLRCRYKCRQNWGAKPPFSRLFFSEREQRGPSDPRPWEIKGPIFSFPFFLSVPRIILLSRALSSSFGALLCLFFKRDLTELRNNHA